MKGLVAIWWTPPVMDTNGSVESVTTTWPPAPMAASPPVRLRVLPALRSGPFRFTDAKVVPPAPPVPKTSRRSALIAGVPAVKEELVS
jgi:hypothetical protein